MVHSADADLLQRLRDRDPAAPSLLCEQYLPLLLGDRRWVPPDVHDPHLIESAVADALLDLVEHPARYNPVKAALLPYLRMAAAGDLKNMLAREARHSKRRAPLEAVELSPPAGNDRQDGAAALPDGVSQELLLRRLREQLPDPRDQAALTLILERVRPVREYARLYGLEELPVAEQQRIVKRHKDRLGKVMKRLGERLRDAR